MIDFLVDALAAYAAVHLSLVGWLAADGWLNDRPHSRPPFSPRTRSDVRVIQTPYDHERDGI